MPRRTTSGGYGGFGGDVPNPFITIQGIRYGPDELPEAFDRWRPQPTTDLGNIEPGNLANAGGSRGAPVPSRTSPQPSRGLTGDNSNAGLVNRNLFRQDNRANDDWWTGGRNNPNRPHEAMDFDANPVTSATAGVSPRSGASGGLNGDVYRPAPSETFDTAGLHNYGEPTVQTPTSNARYVFDENAPSLFPDQNEWWRQGELAQGASTADAGDAGGSIWADTYTPSPTIDSLDLSTFSTGDNLGYTETPRESDNSLSGLNTYDESGEYVPAFNPPDPFQLHDYNENDPQYTNAPPDNDNNLSDLHSYGLPGSGNLANFGGDLSLGAFLNMPLSQMNYGRGYPDVGGGQIQIGAESGWEAANRYRAEHGQPLLNPSDFPGSDIEGSTATTPGGTNLRWNPTTSRWEEQLTNDGTGTTYIPLDDPNVAFGNDGTGTTTFQIPTQSVPEGMTVIGHDTVNGQPIYRDSGGNLFVNPGTGTPVGGSHWDYGQGRYVANNNTSGAQFNSHAANMLLMASQAHGGAPNRVDAGDEFGHNRFNTGRGARFHGEMVDGALMIVPNGPGGGPEGGWTFAPQGAIPDNIKGLARLAALNEWYAANRTPAERAWIAAHAGNRGGSRTSPGVRGIPSNSGGTRDTGG